MSNQKTIGIVIVVVLAVIILWLALSGGCGKKDGFTTAIGGYPGDNPHVRYTDVIDRASLFQPNYDSDPVDDYLHHRDVTCIQNCEMRCGTGNCNSPCFRNCTTQCKPIRRDDDYCAGGACR